MPTYEELEVENIRLRNLLETLIADCGVDKKCIGCSHANYDECWCDTVKCTKDLQ